MSIPIPAPSDTRTLVTAAGRSEAGQVRAVNQDSFFVGDIPGRGLLAVVADGMGGHLTGEVASQKAVEALHQEVVASRVHPPANLAKAVQSANLAVFRHSLAHPEHRGMGTTLTSVFIDDQVGLVGHVGDSRAYLIRDGEIRRLTHDHSWVADRVRQGLLTEEEAKRHRWRNVITNALGATPNFKLDLLHFDVREGDRVLLCSDGVSMLLPDPLLLALVGAGAPEEAVDALIDAANERGSPDNITAVVLEISRLEHRPKRYALPPHYREPASVSMSDTMSGIRQVEADFPVQSLHNKLRRQAWYPYRLWIGGSVLMLVLFAIFSLWRP